MSDLPDLMDNTQMQARYQKEYGLESPARSKDDDLKDKNISNISKIEITVNQSNKNDLLKSIMISPKRNNASKVEHKSSIYKQ